MTAIAIAMVTKPRIALFFISGLNANISDYKNTKRKGKYFYYKRLILFRIILSFQFIKMRNAEFRLRNLKKIKICHFER